MTVNRRLHALLAGLVCVSLLLAACAGRGASKTQTPAPTQNQPTQAKKLSIELWTYTNPRPYNPVGDRLAEAIQSQLAKAGVEVKIKSLPWTEYKKQIRTAERPGDAYLMGWIGDNGDPDNFLYVHFHSSQTAPGLLNAMDYKNPQVDELLTQAAAGSDIKERAKIYAKAHQLIMNDAAQIPFTHANDLAALRSNVTGFTLYPTGEINLRPVDLTGVSGEKVLIYARGADTTSLDPALVDDGESAKPIANIYDRLVHFKPGTTDLAPGLAETWDLSSDGTQVTFHLRKGVKFHDGTDFNADAVIFSIGRQLKDKKTDDMPYADFSFGQIKELKKVDDYTVTVVLKAPYGPIFLNFAMDLAAPIISPAAAQKAGKAYGTPEGGAVGTGPFMFDSWTKDQQIVLKANPNYWGGKPKLDKVIFKVTKDNKVRADELASGAASIIDGIDPVNDLQRLKGSKDVTVLEKPGMNYSYLALRTNRPPFDNVKVRQALAMAIDRKAIVDALYPGIGVLAQGMMPPWMPGSEGVQALPYDVTKAKQLLQEAGYATN